jgi:hypothetical protein
MLIALSRDALACASCGCGDPTLTVMGSEKPLRNRLRAALELRHRTDEVGDPDVDRLRLSEQRLDGQVAWAPHERLFLMASFPILRRDVAYESGARRRTWGTGELEVRAKWFALQDRAFSPRHLVALLAGAKVPTAFVERRSNGTTLPMELQPGTGSLDGIVGVSYGFFSFPWSAYASVHGIVPGPGLAGYRGSASLRQTTALQRQLGGTFAARAALDLRLDGAARENGVPDPNSGGFIAFASPELLFSPATDLTISALAKISMLNRLAGRHREPFVLGTAVAYDF